MRIYILGSNMDFRGNRWRFDVKDAAERLGWTVAYREAQGAHPDDVVREAAQHDIFLWLRANRVDPAGDPWSMVRRIEDFGVATVGLHMDLYWGIENRESLIDPKTNPWFSCQTVYTADGGNAERWIERGIRHVWMPPAMGDGNFGLREIAAGRHIRPYVFVGTCSKGIHGEHRQQLLYWAKRKWPAEFKHYGVNNRIVGEQLNQVYSRARIVLGDSAPGQSYWSDRIPTTMGRGGVLAHPRVAGLAQQGYNDNNILLFNRFDFETLGERIESLSDKDASAMREAALEVTWERHMWRHRLESIARTVLR